MSKKPAIGTLPIKLINVYDRARDLVDRWLEQYGKEDDTRELTKALKDLPYHTTPDEVDNTFARHKPQRGYANKVDRKIICECCCLVVEELIKFDSTLLELQYEEDKSIAICRMCLLKGLRKLEEN